MRKPEEMLRSVQCSETRIVTIFGPVIELSSFMGARCEVLTAALGRTILKRGFNAHVQIAPSYQAFRCLPQNTAVER